MTATLDRLIAALAERYRIERELGAGGMATVYLAEDLRHRRRVAVKVLKPELAAVLGADRFVQEITTTAALQHPHILPLYDSGEAGGFLYYVMPFIDGETLRAKLDRETQLGVDEAVKLTADVADALEYAHGHGVVHRDIKPENILLANGRPLLADFGIALAVSAAADGRMTETGLSLGTPHYMSPEQATAEKQITARSDIYSLGSVLYEMLVGNPPHIGASAQQIIMKIITEPVPPVTSLRRSVPPHVSDAVAQALEKLPADRFSSAKEFADVLRGLAATRAPSRMATAVRPPTARRLRDPLLLSLMTIAAVGIASTAWMASRTGPEASVEPVQFVLVSNVARPVATQTWPAVVSPDGKQIVYAGDAGNGNYQFFVRPVDGLESRPLPGTSNASQPVFSPDSRWIAFETGGMLSKVQLSGGVPVPIVNANAFNGAAWTSRGEIILGSEGAIQGLSRVSDAGGSLVPFTKPDSNMRHIWPLLLQDKKSVLLTVWIGAAGSSAASRLAITSLDDGVVHSLGVVGARALGVVDDHLIYLQADGTVMAVPFDVRQRTVRGGAVPVLDSIPMCRLCNGDAPVYLSTSGDLAYMRGEQPRQLVWVDASGAQRLVSNETRTFTHPRLSPDGRRIAVTIEGRLRDIWMYDVATATRIRLTTGSNNWAPEWTADGTHIVFVSDRDGGQRVWMQSADFTGTAKALSGLDPGLSSAVLSPDGTTLLMTTFVDNIARVVSAKVGEGSERADFAAGAAWAGLARFSPDGRQVAYTSQQTGQDEVYVGPFPGSGGRVQVSVNGGTEPMWSRDGRRLYYLAGRHMMVATLTPPPNAHVVSRDSLFLTEGEVSDYSPAQYDAAVDGKSLLMRRTDQQHVRLVVALRWGSMLREKLTAR
jgi:eukaryotic-like serine/threonine-protein kinase